MKKNMGNVDRTIRVIIALIIGGLYLANAISGTLSIVLLIVAVVLLATSAMSFCPLYRIIGISSCPTEGMSETPVTPVAPAQPGEPATPNNQ